MSDASITHERVTQPLADNAGTLASARRADAEKRGMGLSRRWQTVEDRLAQWSDWLNPILVKETRQALRSWHFTLTFILVLVACWVATIGGIALIGPSVYYAAGGGELLRAYYAILSLPLLLVVPFAAFRSLAAESEDNTYDLISITALGPRQIISGKLASAVVQMVMFYSAITPCLAFTYLLRGVDAPTIALLLAYTFFASIALSLAGLLLATLVRRGYGQVVVSVAFVAALLLVFAEAQYFAFGLVQFGFELYDQPEFWIANGFGAAIYATTVLLAYLAATAMITFATENRSTPLRKAMLVQQAAIIGTFAWLWIISNFEAFVVVGLAIVGGFYWFILGSMLNGEQPQMSRRVMRSLPQSSIGRLFLTWLNPGPASGYMFAVANLTSIVALALLPTILWMRNSALPSNLPDPEVLLYFLVIGWGYVVAYLGLGRLTVAILRRVTEVTMFASVLLHLLLVLIGGGIPTSIDWMSLDLPANAYSYMHVTDPVGTLQYITEFNPAPEAPVLLVLIPAAACCVLLLNLPGLVREMVHVRTALPARVVEDEAELHPPPELRPQSPWDSDE